jgi:small subunit ribosomal protein S16
MVRIRLSRVGGKKQPTYRIIVADRESPRDGRIIENVGLYNPRTEPPFVELVDDRVLYWLSVGAQPSDAVERFIKKAGLREKLAEMRKAAAPQA